MTENSQEKQDLVSWFDPHNIAHIDAYRHLQKNGKWPIGLFPASIHINPNWQTSIAFKLAEAWVDFMLNPNDLLPKKGWIAEKRMEYKKLETKSNGKS